jgi:hypothetical protein
MKSRIASAVSLMIVGLALSACVVAAPGPGGRCGGAGWVPAHYGPGGGWIPGHCR